MIKSLYPKFQEWSKNGSIWIISDTHFEDEDCKLMREDWILPEEHIAILKQYIHKNDTLIHLGDVGNPKWIAQLKGYKILITGNHDAGASNYDPYFNEIYNGPLFISDRILLSHEPIWGLEAFAINIHGHVHCQSDSFQREGHINLASDVTNFQPLHLNTLIKNGLKVENYHRLTIAKAKESSLKN